MAPKVSESYRWTAGAVAGRNSKTPIYILAEDDLQVCNRVVCGYINQSIILWSYSELLLRIPASAVICMCARITVAVCAIYK